MWYLEFVQLRHISQRAGKESRSLSKDLQLSDVDAAKKSALALLQQEGERADGSRFYGERLNGPPQGPELVWREPLTV